jgi:drug/metabolite transporter (DMT)-like permease
VRHLDYSHKELHMTTKPEALPQRGTHQTNYLQLALLIFIWASNWPLTKTILGDISAVGFTTVRFILSVPVLVGIVLLVKEPLLPLPGERLWLGIAGTLQVGGMLGFGTLALQFVGPGRTAVLIYTMQLWAIVLGRLIIGERVRPQAIAGGLIGFAGMILFLNPRLVNWHDHRVILGNGFALASGFVWALGACFYRRDKWQSPFWTQVFWQVSWSTVAMIAVALIFPQHRPIIWTRPLLLIFGYNVFMGTVYCYWAWSKALTVLPVSRAGQIVSLVPVVAVTMSVMWSGEKLTRLSLLSIALIMLGIVLTMRSKQPAAATLRDLSVCSEQ